MEEWREIRNFPQYAVSSRGRIKNIKTDRILKPSTNNRGYHMILFREEGKTYCRTVHRVVAEAFSQHVDEGHTPIHKDGDITNNAIHNLEWKPDWFARAKNKQDRRGYPLDTRRVRHVRSDLEFKNSLTCAIHFGGLEQLVLNAAMDGSYYLGSQIEFVKKPR